MAQFETSILTVHEARGILGSSADSLSDEQIKTIISAYDQTARLLIRSSMVLKTTKHEN